MTQRLSPSYWLCRINLSMEDAARRRGVLLLATGVCMTRIIIQWVGGLVGRAASMHRARIFLADSPLSPEAWL